MIHIDNDPQIPIVRFSAASAFRTGLCLVWFRVGKCPEGWPSGQWQQTVNLPTEVYVGSNPTPSTTLSVRELA